MNIQRRARARGTFSVHNPQWMDMAAEVLFRKERLENEEGVYDIQQAVAEALKVAHEMGAAGRFPPTPNGAPRSYRPPPEDPEIERIANELRMLAWSPLSGTKPPPGHLGWLMRRNKAAAEEPKKVIRRRNVEPQPEETPKTIVRRRR